MSSRAELWQKIYTKVCECALVQAVLGQEPLIYYVQALPESEFPYLIANFVDKGLRDNDTMIHSNLIFSVYTFGNRRLLNFEIYDAVTKCLHWQCVGKNEASFFKNDDYTPVATDNENVHRSDFSFTVRHVDEQLNTSIIGGLNYA